VNPLEGLLHPPPEWTLDALCAQIGGDPFFPRKGSNGADAKRICARCEVKAQCLEYALEMEDSDGVEGLEGIWGGLTEMERRPLKRKAA
jgi:WhiB family redox-sensing transcriptional regulator